MRKFICIFIILFLVLRIILSSTLNAEENVSTIDVRTIHVNLNSLNDLMVDINEKVQDTLKQVDLNLDYNSFFIDVDQRVMDKISQMSISDIRALEMIINRDIPNSLYERGFQITRDGNTTIIQMTGAGNNDFFNQEVIKTINEEGFDVDIQTNEGNTIIHMTRHRINRSDTPFLGINHQNLTVSRASELGYEYDFGVLITGTVPNSPARMSRIAPNDILMSIEGIRVLNTEQISDTLARFFVGDTVTLEIFRDREAIEIEVELGERRSVSDNTASINVNLTRKRRDVGYGGGSWYPIWFHKFPVSDVNNILGQFGFAEFDIDGELLSGGLPTDGILFQGGGGKGNVGQGWFLGGMGAGYSTERKKHTLLELEDSEAIAVLRRYKYSAHFWGVSLDKRFAITDRFLISPGFMIGGAGHKLTLSQVSGDLVWDEFEKQLLSTHNVNETLRKGYVMVQPRFEMLFMMVEDWLGLRCEVGYLFGYSRYNGWKNEIAGDDYEVPNSPNSSFEGWTFSIGPWFGF